MAEDSTAPTEAAQTPLIVGTPAEPQAATAEMTPAAKPVDWEKRYYNLQADHSRQVQGRAAAEARAAEFEALLTTEEPEPTEAQAPRPRRDLSAELQHERGVREALEWQIAEGVYGEDVLSAYDTSAGMIENAGTVADTIAAFEAYHQARSGGAPPPAEADAPRRTEAVAPQVLAPRPDEAQAQQLYERDVEAARQVGGDAGLRALMRASLKKAGLSD